MVQKRNLVLCVYDYTIHHRGAKQIQHADYISRQSLRDKPVITADFVSDTPTGEKSIF